MTSDKFDRLQEIQQEIKELVREAKAIVRGTSEESRAKGYWIANILTALDDEHDYLNSSMVTMEDSIERLRDEIDKPTERSEPALELAHERTQYPIDD